jgi:hypothetical protein
MVPVPSAARMRSSSGTYYGQGSCLSYVGTEGAAQSGCEELITTEKPTEAIHRSKLVRVISIDAE